MGLSWSHVADVLEGAPGDPQLGVRCGPLPLGLE